jgi:hypothetical protein
MMTSAYIQAPILVDTREAVGGVLSDECDPLSCFFSIPMICASVNRDCFIVRLLAWTDSPKPWREKGAQVM